MHSTLILALASLASARTLEPRLHQRSNIVLPQTPFGGLAATAKPAVGSVLGDGAWNNPNGLASWIVTCTQAIQTLCSSSQTLGTVDKWVSAGGTCQIELWQPNPNPTNPNLTKGVAPLTLDNCNFYFTQLQTTLHNIVALNLTVDRGSVNIVNFPSTNSTGT